MRTTTNARRTPLLNLILIPSDSMRPKLHPMGELTITFQPPDMDIRVRYPATQLGASY